MSRDGFKVLDSDMHIMEPADLWEKYIDPSYREQAPRIKTKEPRDMTVEVAGQLIPIPEAHLSPQSLDARLQLEELQEDQYRYPIEHGWDAASQLKAMDEEGLDLAVMYPSRGLMPLGMDGLDPGLAAAIAAAYNDWLYDFCQTDPSRMYGAAMVPPHNIPAAVREVRRTAEKLGFRGVFLRPNLVGGRNWYDDYYEPLWTECEELGIPIGFHEGGRIRLPQTGSQFASQALYHTCSHSMEMMLATVGMIGGGVLERHPALKVAFLEANCSWVPWLLWRLEEHLEYGGFGWAEHPDLTIKATEYFKRQCYVSLEPDESPAKYAIDWLGDNNIVFSTDYPHLDSKYPHALEGLLKLPFPDETKKKFLWGNCANFYSLAALPVTN